MAPRFGSKYVRTIQPPDMVPSGDSPPVQRKVFVDEMSIWSAGTPGASLMSRTAPFAMTWSKTYAALFDVFFDFMSSTRIGGMSRPADS